MRRHYKLGAGSGKKSALALRPASLIFYSESD
jgi:hypothetical protein